MKTLILTVTIILGFLSATFAQVSATATASATIITPIAISKTVDMNFGNVAVSAVAGTVVLTPAGVRTKTGGVTLPVVAGTISAASFTVTGLGSYTYTITLPSTPLTISSGANTMTVNAFNSTPSGTGTLSGGTQVLNVGATLNVGVNQAAGLYTSATPFTVTVNYN
jgi:hypothetical protein